jgi:hypothetical protein
MLRVNPGLARSIRRYPVKLDDLINSRTRSPT